MQRERARKKEEIRDEMRKGERGEESKYEKAP
jgi:hypothetical protein